ncbi:bifunctional 3,4-dihydroxy-2-butanone-4-phosphate synthase/GTP cyclohydrolase II [Clostridium sp. DSM 100503]|uniref:bifunctional 3,4-dihydroxy-2-butanone-4-phosphate synthase/GTP cyclohydrolase II n=1 Tax=Clostridium sp. DSM 100503 TaxID=2963282 RepID=UPI00214A6939|nr:bifunctional 3,4-dihydroxy-2-butanone-4-phosphate synthase/GTP cyclohydrolase II [Clostridium sp. DSM 100503]MCR1950039.1 bifunctional 3,4-dihydroxy-2-butanone-4-phosphate synthase/GTP cyclohydrolase II [Clostridium sp. DSM 100503]
MYKFNSIEEAINEIKEGKMIIVIDDEGRENEGDLLMAAEKVTGEAINFMATYGKGLICMPIKKETADKLNIGSMVSVNTDNHETAFTVSVDHIDTTTGISAYERSLTIKKLLDENSTPIDFRRPGHMFPLIAKENGVLERRGHTEAAVDLAKLAGLKEAGVICEIIKEDGSMARTNDLFKFAKKHNLKIITIDDLVSYRQKEELLIQTEAEIEMPTKYGNFKMYGFTEKVSGKEHVALVLGDIENADSVLVRVHSECLTGDIFGSKRCDCGEQLDFALKAIREEGTGILLYMRQEGRGIGLINKLKAYKLQEEGYDTVEANLKLGFQPDLRNYDIAASILKSLKVSNVKLMTNNPEKVKGLEGYGISVSERVPVIIKANNVNDFYLKTKKEKMNHILY